jgi:uncharacterized protein YjiS (DUF1127 family)
MNTTTLCLSTPRRPAARLAAVVEPLLHQLLGYMERRRKARALREVMRLNDHALRDIGIDRFQLHVAMRR